jgi:Rap1a immunity proteins
VRPILLLALAATLSSSRSAQPTGALGRLSGAQVVDRWIGPAKWDRTQAQLYALQFVDGYLVGVADATEGVRWCDTRQRKAHEIDADLVWAIKDMPRSKTERTAAAKLMVELLAKSFPCQQGKP